MELEFYMKRCLDLARLGEGNVSPNPLVGCVIYYNGVVIGEGYHHKAGEAHAEVNAVNSVKDPSLLPGSIMFVSLEPCCHYGKTPPCTNLIIEKQIKKVVIAQGDPNKKVNGNGIKLLQDAGIDVIVGVLEEEAVELNKRFNAYHSLRRPYIILKWAKTLDGFIDIENNLPGNNVDNWITGKELNMLVHKWRSIEDAIIVGTNTAANDNPRLNVREWTGKNPLRIVIDKDLRLDLLLHLFDGNQQSIVYTSKTVEDKKNLSFVKLDFNQQLIPQILNDLYNRKIQSLIVEGGRKLLDSFINSGLWDEARILTGNKKFIKGLPGPVISGNRISSQTIGDDNLLIIRNSHGYHQDK